MLKMPSTPEKRHPIVVTERDLRRVVYRLEKMLEAGEELDVKQRAHIESILKTVAPALSLTKQYMVEYGLTRITY